MTIDKILRKTEKLNSDEIEQVLTAYKPFVLRLSRRFFIIGGDSDDLSQEGMIGLYEALRKWNPAKNSNFDAYAGMCINRRLISAIKKAGRKKHKPLNESISVEYLEAETVIDPESILISKERNIEFSEELKAKLTTYEKKVLNAYLDGMSYGEIAKVLGRNAKSIDNAIQRIKTKLKEYI